MSFNTLYSKVTTGGLKVLSKCINVPKAPLVEGEGSLIRVANYCKIKKYNSALIVTAPFLAGSPKLQPLFDKFKSFGIKFWIFDKVEGEPTFDLCEEVKRIAVEDGVDVVVAIGGGSVIDLAKIVCAGVTNEKPLKKLAGVMKVYKKPLPLFAVPTTAGTGSETTFISVISDSSGQKKTIVSPKIVPDLAVLDPNLLIGAPTKLVASTGIDALSHAIESYISTCTKDGHDFYAPTAIKMIFENLKTCVEQPQNIEARSKMLKASYLAGISMNNEMVGYAHAFAHQLGAFYHIPHGEAIAMVLVKVLKFEHQNCDKKLAELGLAIGLDEGLGEEILSKLFVEKVATLIREIGLPQYCKQVKRSDFEAIIENAFKETAYRYPVARFMEKDEAYKFLETLEDED